MMNRNHEIAPGGTLKDLKTGEAMHSSIGAWEEANSLYVAQSELAGLTRREPLVVYDLGMGVAANAIALLSALKNSGQPVRLISFENDPSGLALALEQLEHFPYLRDWEGLLEALLSNGRVERTGLLWELHVGDFVDVDLNGLPRANLIYFDFYSPKVCGRLWSVEIFTKLREACAPDSRLLTYSSATHARVAMLLAGFYVGRGLSTAAKLETTLAALQSERLHDPLRLEWLRKLERSTRVLPYGWDESRREEVLESIRLHPQFRDLRG